MLITMIFCMYIINKRTQDTASNTKSNTEMDWHAHPRGLYSYVFGETWYENSIMRSWHENTFRNTGSFERKIRPLPVDSKQKQHECRALMNCLFLSWIIFRRSNQVIGEMQSHNTHVTLRKIILPSIQYIENYPMSFMMPYQGSFWVWFDQ